MIKVSTTIFLLSICLTNNALPIEMTGKVRSVIDGNTIDFLSSDNETFKFVFSGIDCPELNQKFGDEAKRQLEKILAGKLVTIIVESKDRSGNRVGSIRLSKGQDPRIDLLKKGLAWTQEKNPNPEFENLKEEAKRNRMGLWSQENPVAPWIHRRQQSMLAPKMG